MRIHKLIISSGILVFLEIIFEAHVFYNFERTIESLYSNLIF
jgi:hypothetical protein